MPGRWTLTVDLNGDLVEDEIVDPGDHQVPAVPVDEAAVRRATDAIVKTHAEETEAYLCGEIETNVWRPERYARAALRAAGEQE